MTNFGRFVACLSVYLLCANFGLADALIRTVVPAGEQVPGETEGVAFGLISNLVLGSDGQAAFGAGLMRTNVNEYNEAH